MGVIAHHYPRPDAARGTDRSTRPTRAESRPSEALDAADADLRAVEAALARIDAAPTGACDVCDAAHHGRVARRRPAGPHLRAARGRSPVDVTG